MLRNDWLVCLTFAQFWDVVFSWYCIRPGDAHAVAVSDYGEGIEERESWDSIISTFCLTNQPCVGKAELCCSQNMCLHFWLSICRFTQLLLGCPITDRLLSFTPRYDFHTSHRAWDNHCVYTISPLTHPVANSAFCCSVDFQSSGNPHSRVIFASVCFVTTCNNLSVRTHSEGQCIDYSRQVRTEHSLQIRSLQR